MNYPNPFALVEREIVQKQTQIGRATLWRRIKAGKFPAPFAGGTSRACWPQLQITDYLYQVARHGDWSKQRSDEALDRAHEEAVTGTTQLVDRGDTDD